jgi:hypothetical protein
MQFHEYLQIRLRAHPTLFLDDDLPLTVPNRYFLDASFAIYDFLENRGYWLLVRFIPSPEDFHLVIFQRKERISFLRMLFGMMKNTIPLPKELARKLSEFLFL